MILAFKYGTYRCSDSIDQQDTQKYWNQREAEGRHCDHIKLATVMSRLIKSTPDTN